MDLDREDTPPPAEASTIAVVGSGNLGLIYFTGHDHRLTAEELKVVHPALIETLAAHPGIVMLEGEDPTELFGPHVVMSLKCEDEMTHAPDPLLICQYDPEFGEVAAFEELIGSHGGLGGPQSQPFIVYPSDRQLDEPVPLGAPASYRNIRRWHESIGIELGTEAPSAAPGSNIDADRRTHTETVRAAV